MKDFFDKNQNRKERMNFVEFWAEYVRKHSDKEWSKQQKIIIDSQLKTKVKLEDYLQMIKK